jgi:hypothetical protein
MEGYREPDARPEQPKELALCEKHGLRFDRAVQAGCTICRREHEDHIVAADAEHTSGAIRRLGIVLVVLAIGGGGSWFFYKRWAASKAAPIGSPCEAQFGCVEGAHCMTRGIVPGSRGKCYRACSAVRPCPSAGEACSSGVCMPAAGVGADCSGDVACTDGSECISLTGRSSQCLVRCASPFGSNDACPSGYTCTRVANSLMPLEPTMMQDYCVPNR